MHTHVHMHTRAHTRTRAHTVRAHTHGASSHTHTHGVNSHTHTHSVQAHTRAHTHGVSSHTHAHTRRELSWASALTSSSLPDGPALTEPPCLDLRLFPDTALTLSQPPPPSLLKPGYICPSPHSPPIFSASSAMRDVIQRLPAVGCDSSPGAQLPSL